MKARVLSIFILFFTFFVSALICEAALHILFILPQPLANYYPLEVAKLGRTIQINQYEFKTEHNYNQQGFRDKEITIEKSANKKRILFVGDSFVEGFGVSENNRFSNKVVAQLGEDFEGINIGQLATNPDTYFDNIAKFGIALEPDLIVMGIYMGNDFQGGKDLPPPKKENLKLNIEKSSSSFLSLSYIRALWNQVKTNQKTLVRNVDLKDKNFWDLYFNQKIDRRYFEQNNKLTAEDLDKAVLGFNPKIVEEAFAGRMHPGMIGEAIRNQLKSNKEKASLPFVYTDADFTNMYKYIKAANEIASSNGINFMVVIIPDLNQIHPTEFRKVLKKDFLVKEVPAQFEQLEGLQTKLIGNFKKDNIAFIDPTQNLKSSGQLTYYLYDNHMNNLGHKILADLLVVQIQKLLK